VLYVALWSKWLAWDGKRWKADDTLRVEDMGKRVAQGLWKLLVETVAANPGMDAKQQKEIISFVKASNNTRGIRNMLELVRSDVAEVPETFDSYPWLLNCANGTIDLQTGELRKHRREDYITKLCPTEYRRSEPAPTWKRFLETTFAENEAVIRFVQRLLGYSLTGITTEHSLGIFHGCGSNGKSTLIEAVMGTIGDDYAQPAAPDLLLTKKGQHPTEIADLHGKRLIACIETDEGRRLAEGLVKQLTGGDRLKARRMREDFWAFTATHKLILACNHRPEIRGTDNGIWRRIHLVPFEVVFSGEQKDTSLPEKLKTEAEGILAWMVEGCLAWQREGLNPPPQVQAATNEYRAEQDTLAAFIENCCIVGNNYSAAAGDLFEAYKEFGGELSQTRFGKAMAERGFARGRFSFGSNRGRTSWSGIGMLDGGENSDF
jgi:putative DNA primase/helicase